MLAEGGGVGEFWQARQQLIRYAVLCDGFFDKWMQLRFVHHVSPG
jgi:hypothetical protein